MRGYVAGPALVLLVLAAAPPARGEAYLSRSEALEAAFPGASVTARDLFLTEEERTALVRRARQPVASALQCVYEARRDGVRLGWAVLDARPVRSQTAALLVATDPVGKVAQVLVLAFHEPGEYLPGARWLARLAGRAPGDELRPGRDVDAISGATLSARSFSDAVRLATALVELAARKGP